MIEIKKTEYLGFENSYLLSNGNIDVIVTTDIGPRVLFLGFKGEKNQFCIFPDHIGKKNQNEFLLYGGTRLWHSPEDIVRTYYPDSKPIDFEIINNGIILKQPVEETTKLQKTIEVCLDENHDMVYVNYKIKNVGLFEVKFSNWALSVMAAGGVEILPIPKFDVGLLPSYQIVYWPYTKLNDKRITWGEDFIILRQDSSCEGPFKIGYPNFDGWASYLNDGVLFTKYYKHIEGAEYPDFGCSFETYTNNLMLEVETLSPLYLVKPNEEICHKEVWELTKVDGIISDEESVKKYILPHIKKGVL